MIAAPVVHFGLGEAERAEVARITWPNGFLQSEFDLGADAVIAASQRLKGSCPWLFAWNGTAMGFVTDFIWRSPLGLRINARAADVQMTEDWVRIRGDQLAPRNGEYDLRITAELWETTSSISSPCSSSIIRQTRSLRRRTLRGSSAAPRCRRDLAPQGLRGRAG